MHLKQFTLLLLTLLACLANTYAQSADTLNVKDSATYSPAPFPAAGSARYRGGDEAIRRFISTNIVYPREARQK